jgi:hypothetical protein
MTRTCCNKCDSKSARTFLVSYEWLVFRCSFADVVLVAAAVAVVVIVVVVVAVAAVAAVVVVVAIVLCCFCCCCCCCCSFFFTLLLRPHFLGNRADLPYYNVMAPRPRAAYYINFGNPLDPALISPFVWNGHTYNTIGWNPYDPLLGYGWCGESIGNTAIMLYSMKTGGIFFFYVNYY